ncbi:hypothetical protein CL654_01385 [bacterium]|nr:hypothetical protein [bacterium]|tara:strand:+ start:16486 stop:16824 length:339 start_codon:yes stop_codon:yes gene_type:complete
MKDPKNLQELIDLIDKVFWCDEEVYWKLRHLPKERWDYEIISHSSRHLSKSAGKLASVCEAYEHGTDFDKDKAKDITLSALATVLKIASMLEMTAEDLLEGVPKKIKYNPQK